MPTKYVLLLAPQPSKEIGRKVLFTTAQLAEMTKEHVIYYTIPNSVRLEVNGKFFNKMKLVEIFHIQL